MTKLVTKTVSVALLVALCSSAIFAQVRTTKKQTLDSQKFVSEQRTVISNDLTMVAKKAEASSTKNSNSRGSVFYEGFEGTTGNALPAGWFKTTATPAWGSSSGAPDGTSPHDGTRMALNTWATTARNAWMITPAINLTAGTEYSITFYLRMAGWDTERDKLEVRLGQAQTVAGMTASGSIEVYKNETDAVTSWTLITKPFTPTTTGNYYLGFHAYTGYNLGYSICVDDIDITFSQPPCPIITNLQYAIQGSDAILTWNAPAEGEPAGYKVYEGNTLLATVTTTKCILRDLSYGEHTFGVEAFYDAPCDPVRIVTTLNIKKSFPVTNLNGNCDNGSLTLTWNEPVLPSSMKIQYVEGLGGAIGIETAAHELWPVNRYTPTDLAAAGIMTGMKLEKVGFCPTIAQGNSITSATYTIKVWSGGTFGSIPNPGTLLTSKTLVSTSLTAGQWNDITLDTPITIDATQELWIGYQMVSTAGGYYCGSGDGAIINEKSNVCYFGDEWGTLGFAWAVRGFFTTEGITVTVDHYDVYKDDVLFGQPTTNTFSSTSVTEGKSDYCVVVVYDNDVYSDKVCKQIICGDNYCEPARDLSVTYTTDCKAQLSWSRPATKDTRVVLWDNTNIGADNSGLASNYYSVNDNWVYSADDFVADEIWKIEKITTQGFSNTSSSPSPLPTKMSVVIYKNASGNKPGTEIYRNDAINVNIDEGIPFIITLPDGGFTLPEPGRYWVTIAGAYDVSSTESANYHWYIYVGATPKEKNAHRQVKGNVWQDWADLLSDMDAVSLYFKMEGQVIIVPRKYNVYRDDVKITTLNNTETYTDTTLDPTMGHTWAVKNVCNGELESAPIEQTKSACVNVCPKVTNAQVLFNNTNTQATITWTAAQYAQGYIISRGGQVVGEVTETTFIDEYDFVSGGTDIYTWTIVTKCSFGNSDAVTVEGMLGIRELINNFSVYPNPASTKVVIEGENIVKVEVYNGLGVLVKTQKGNVKSIDVSKYNLGSYIFKVYDVNNNVVTKQITILR